MSHQERLQKVMAHAGVASRRHSEKIIQEGRVKVNGQVVTELGTRVGPNDLVEVDDVPIYREEPRYIMLYKPRNTISAVSDDRGRDTVVECVKGIEERIYPVGRLDFDTTGLLLLTNDGNFSHVLMHPRYQVPKVYIASIDGIPTQGELTRLSRGVQLEEGKTSPAQARILSTNRQKNSSVVQLTIHEGWNHQVKRMFEAIGYKVSRLKRERLGFLDLGRLNPGQWRELTAFEVGKLLAQATSGKD